MLAQDRRKFKGRLEIEIDVFQPTRQRHDISNRVKAVEDALVDAGIMIDDEQVDRIVVNRRCVTKGGLVIVTIKELENGHNRGTPSCPE